MNFPLKALMLSLAFHSLLFFFLIKINPSFVHTDKMLFIDFTMEDAFHTENKPFTNNDLKSHNVVFKENKSAQTHSKYETKQLLTKISMTQPEIVIEELPALENNNVITQIPDKNELVTIPKMEERKNNGHHKEAFISSSTVDTPSPGSTHGTVRPLSTFFGGSIPTDKHSSILYLKDHFSYIRNLIQKNIIYPNAARRMEWEGTVTVSFIIKSDGRVQNIKVVRSSGKEILDRNAIDTIKKVSPFPHPPIMAEIKMPIIYRLY